MPLSGNGRGTDSGNGLIREGMLDRLLRRLVRPRVEAPLERVTITPQGDQELRFAPLRIKYATYDKAANRLDVVVLGGRVALSTGGADVAAATVQVSAPAISTTYWLYVNSTGAFATATAQPAAGNIEMGTITTPSAWPASTTLKGFLNTFDDLQHGVKNQATGDSWVTLSDRRTLVWSGTAWTVLLTVADKRPWFAVQGSGGTGAGRLEVVVAASNATTAHRNMADYVCDGISDQIQIQAACDAVAASGNGGVVLTEGDFSIDAPINVSCNIRGQGAAATNLVVHKHAATAPNVTVTAASGSVLQTGTWTINVAWGFVQPGGYRFGAFTTVSLTLTSGQQAFTVTDNSLAGTWDTTTVNALLIYAKPPFSTLDYLYGTITTLGGTVTISTHPAGPPYADSHSGRFGASYPDWLGDGGLVLKGITETSPYAPTSHQFRPTVEEMRFDNFQGGSWRAIISDSLTATGGTIHVSLCQFKSCTVGVHMTTGANAVITNCEFVSCLYGVYWYTGGSGKQSRVTGSSFRTCSYGMKAESMTANGVQIDGNEFYNTSIGVWAVNSHGVVVIGNEFQSASVAGVIGDTCQGLQVIGNSMKSISENGVQYLGGTCTQWLIADNRFNGCYYGGVGRGGGGYLTYSLIKGNIFSDSTAKGLDLSLAADCSIIGNYFYGNGATGTGNDAYINGDRCNIQLNTFRNGASITDTPAKALMLVGDAHLCTNNDFKNSAGLDSAGTTNLITTAGNRF